MKEFKDFEEALNKHKGYMVFDSVEQIKKLEEFILKLER